MSTPPPRRGGRFDMVFSVTGTAINGGVRFLYNVVIGNLRGPAFLGAVGSAVSTSMFAAMLFPQATANAATTFVSRSHGTEIRGRSAADAVAWHLWKMLLVSSLVLGLAAGALVAVNLDRGWVFTGSAVLLTIAYSAYIFCRAVQFAYFRSRRAMISDTASGVVAIGLVVLVLTAGLDELVLLPLAFGYLVAAAIARPPRAHGLDPALRAEIRSFVLVGTLGALASGGMLQLSMVMAGVFGTPAETGHYAAALSIATPLSMISTAISMVVVPAMSAAIGVQDTERFRTILDHSFRGVASLAVGAFSVLVVVSPLVIRVLYPPEFAEAVPALVLLSLAMLFLTARGPAEMSIVVATPGGIRTTTTVGVTSTVVGIALWFVLGPTFGVVGIAVGVLVANLVAYVVVAVVAGRATGMRWGGLGVRVAAALAATSIAATAVATSAASTTTTALIGAAVVVVWFVALGWPERRGLVATMTGHPEAD